MSHVVFKVVIAASALYVGALLPPPAFAQQKTVAAKTDSKQVERGRYLVRITGCNDCHTAGYAPSGGKIPESQWLMGDRLGWRGPWGTTYPVNLRIYMANVTQDQWVKAAKTMETRPPMPWFALRDMSEPDLKAIYHYVRSLKPAGQPAPAFVPPDKDPTGPVIQFPAPPK